MVDPLDNVQDVKKNFKANVITQAINNISYSTHHLKGTN